MLIRGQTTEQRIAEIANGFGKGLDNYNQGQSQQRAQSLQDEALKRQQAIQAFEIESKMAEQTGNVVPQGTGAAVLNGLPVDFSALKAMPKTAKAEVEEKRKAREELKFQQDQEEAEYKRNQRALPPTQRDSFQEKAALTAMKASSAPKENLTYQQKLEMKSKHDLNNEGLKKPSPDQRKVATFFSRVEQAENDFKKLTGSGYNRASLEESSKSMLPNALKSENLKLQDQAERNFINAVLRRESGAAIAPSEFSSAEIQYFPRVGDTPEVVAQKAKNREIVMAGLKAEAGERAVGEIKSQLGGQQSPQLKAGVIEDGYEYLGGDPADSSSWKKA